MDLKQKLADLPEKPGVYLMYDADGNLLYVGKAKVLKNRVRQYFFQSGNKTEKVMLMVSRIADFRYVITASETDAFALENTLIKQHQPPYNILLKDDKQYPYIKINVTADYPKIETTRKVLKDRAKYFGPVTGNSKELLNLLRDLFPTVSCNLNFYRLPSNVRPCLKYHLGKCPAPCAGKISVAEYHKTVDAAVRFLNGDDASVFREIERKMKEASEREEYEKALQYKQQLNVLNRMHETRIATMGKLVDLDLFSICSNGKSAVVNLQLVRKGRIIVSENHAVFDAGLDETQTLFSFLNRYYADRAITVKEILVSCGREEAATFAEFLSEKAGRKIEVTVPQRGDKRKLTELSLQNARDYLQKSENRIDRQRNLTIGAVEQLKEVLHLETLPKRIECFDISNVSGVDKVASMAVFEMGEKATSAYRRFRIRTVEGANDFASMKEVLLRRFARWEDASFGAKADLILVDGGLGQLNYACQAREESGVDVPLAALAERDEWLYVPGSNVPIILPKTTFALNMLINLRDEAHRFAITYFRGLHGKNALRSELESLPGMGKKRIASLRKAYPSEERLKQASVDELSALLPRPVAQTVFDYFHPQSAAPANEPSPGE